MVIAAELKGYSRRTSTTAIYHP